MRRQIPGLGEFGDGKEVPDGVFLVRVTRVRQHWEAHKPYFTIGFAVLAPAHWIGRTFSARLYATRKAQWKLNWFLRDFGYDAAALAQEEIEEKALRGLQGVVKLGHVMVQGRSWVNLEAFAPAARWEELSDASSGSDLDAEAAS